MVTDRNHGKVIIAWRMKSVSHISTLLNTAYKKHNSGHLIIAKLHSQSEHVELWTCIKYRRLDAFCPGTSHRRPSILGKINTSLTKLLNFKGLAWTKGQNNAEGHDSGTVILPTPECSSSFQTDGNIRDTGGQIQLFSLLHSWANASTPALPGAANLELNLGSWALFQSPFRVDFSTNWRIDGPIVLIDVST